MTANTEKPNNPEGIRHPETLSEVLNAPPLLSPPAPASAYWHPPRASSAVSVGVLAFPPECRLG